MYLGRKRRDRTVAMVLASALVGVAVLGLLVTLAASGAGAPPEGTPYGAAPSPTSPAADPRSRPPVAQEVAPHGDHPTIDPAGADSGHPWRLVGTLVGVVLLFCCGVLVTHEQRRRAGEGGPQDGPGEWIS